MVRKEFGEAAFAICGNCSFSMLSALFTAFNMAELRQEVVTRILGGDRIGDVAICFTIHKIVWTLLMKYIQRQYVEFLPFLCNVTHLP